MITNHDQLYLQYTDARIGMLLEKAATKCPHCGKFASTLKETTLNTTVREINATSHRYTNQPFRTTLKACALRCPHCSGPVYFPMYGKFSIEAKKSLELTFEKLLKLSRRLLTMSSDMDYYSDEGLFEHACLFLYKEFDDVFSAYVAELRVHGLKNEFTELASIVDFDQLLDNPHLGEFLYTPSRRS